MKYLIVLLMFSSLSAHALSYDFFDHRDMSRIPRCALQACAMNDQGHTYTQMCSELRQMPGATIMRKQPVVILTEGRMREKCVCPCDYALESRAREL